MQIDLSRCNNDYPSTCPHRNCVCILYTKIVQDVGSYTTDVYKIYTRCIQNVSLISINFCIYFVYKIQRTIAAKFCIRNVYKSFPKFEIHSA